MSAGRIPTTANSPLTAKGDLFSFSTAPARLAVGSNGDTIVADASTATGLRYQGNYAAGKNAIINGAFDNWQRGTSITVPIANNSYSGSDRFQFSRNGTSSVVTVSRQAFTPGTAPQAGYEGNFFMRFNQTTAGSGGSYNEIITRLENVTTFAGQTVTFSFWAKADSTRTLPNPVINQNFGSGGSSAVGTNVTLNSNTLTTAFARYTGTVTLPSISGKTIGTSSFLEIDLQLFMNTTFTFDTWGWELEAGSVATAFQTATGTIQGELAACRYYYERILPNSSGTGYSGIGHYYDTTNCYTIQNWQQKRVVPTVTFSGATHFTANGSGVNKQSTAVNLDVATTWGCDYRITTSTTTLGATAVMGIQSTSGYIEASAEL